MASNRHLIVIGMMGTGKTALGKNLSPLLELPLADTDAEVERRTGKNISRLFEEEGEAFFRRMEKEVLYGLLAGPPAVITTGGGIVLDPENVQVIKEKGWVVALQAEPDEIIRRLRGDSQRPLLTGDLAGKVRRLAKQRRHLYAFADITIDTTDVTPEEAARQVLQAWKRTTEP
jgi:shikimate kinase